MTAHRHRASAVCTHSDKLLVVYLEDPATAVVRPYLPGGAIEKGESPEQAAIRETFEESGYQVTINSQSERVLEYPFVWAQQTYQCRTHFFKAHLFNPGQQPAPVQDACFHRGAGWLPLTEVTTAFGYHPPILGEMTNLLSL